MLLPDKEKLRYTTATEAIRDLLTLRNGGSFLVGFLTAESIEGYRNGHLDLPRAVALALLQVGFLAIVVVIAIYLLKLAEALGK